MITKPRRLVPGQSPGDDLANRLTDAAYIANYVTVDPPLNLAMDAAGIHFWLDGDSWGGSNITVGPHWTFGTTGSPGGATVTLAPDSTITNPTADGTWNLGYSSGAPLTVNYNFGTLAFPVTSSNSVAPAAVLVIPTISTSQPAKPTWMTTGQLACAGKLLWQGTSTDPVTYPPIKTSELIASPPPVNQVMVWDQANLQLTMPNMIQADLTNKTLGINTPTTTTEAITITPATSTPTVVEKIVPVATTQTNLLLQAITSQTASPFVIKDPSGNPLLEAITTTGANLTLQFGVTNVVNVPPVSYISLPTATVSGPFTWTPPANTYSMVLNSLDKKLAFWDGAAWKYLIPSPLTTKGDLWGYGSVDVRVPVGTDEYLLTANSAQTTGLQYRNLTSSDASITITITSGNIDIKTASGGITGTFSVNHLVMTNVANVSIKDSPVTDDGTTTQVNSRKFKVTAGGGNVTLEDGGSGVTVFTSSAGMTFGDTSDAIGFYSPSQVFARQTLTGTLTSATLPQLTTVVANLIAILGDAGLNLFKNSTT